MRTLIWSNSFVRTFKRLARRNPQLRQNVERTLQQLVENPYHPTLHTHKLKGNLSGSWACTVAYDFRILFDFVENPNSDEEAIFLLTLGKHDEVY